MKDLKLPCICGHLKREHRLGCADCHYDLLDKDYGPTKYYQERRKIFHDFKLDNLAYVEQVARARGLV